MNSKKEVVAMAWLSAEINPETYEIELWNVNFDKVGILKHGDPIVYFTGGTRSQGQIAWDGSQWIIQTRDMRKLPFPPSPFGLIVEG